MKERFVYVDWMKAIGMFLIIWGHFFPSHLSKYIYAINVPIFMFVSGYLSSAEKTEWSLWWKKQWRSLILPYFALCLINIAIRWIIGGIDSLDVFLYRIHLCFLGFNCSSQKGIDGCGTLWFVYSLFVIRLIDRLINGRQYKFVVTFMMFVAGIMLGRRSFHIVDYWAVQTVPLCYTIYALGQYLRKIDVISILKSVHVKVILFIVSIVLFYFSVRGNGAAMLFNAEYGKSYIRFIIGVLTGISAIGMICLFLNAVSSRLVKVISDGTLMTMALHGNMIYLCKRFLWQAIQNEQVKYFIFSLLILLAFVPLILLAENNFPWLIGKHRKV